MTEKKEGKCTIRFPEYEENRQERIRKLIASTESWSRSEYMVDLLSLFGYEIDCSKPFNEYIEDLNNCVSGTEENGFIGSWDFRGMMKVILKEDIERFGLEDDAFWIEHFPDMFRIIQANANYINEAALALGMDDVRTPVSKPDYLLALGGARNVNVYRPRMCRFLIDNSDWNDITVVGLGGSRIINKKKKEWDVIKKYAPKARSEYDALNVGMKTTFEIDRLWKVEEPKDIKPDQVEWYSVRTSKKKYKECKILTIAAPPITCAPKRANSYDSFLYFIQKINLKPGDKVVMVTSSLYCQYQGMSFADIAVDKGISFQIVGTDDSIESTSYESPMKYLQEIKATINLIYKFMHPTDIHCEEYGLDPLYIEDVKQVVTTFFS